MNVWQKLSTIDVNQHTEKKGRFTYLSWTWAWATLMEHYPDSTYEFGENEIHSDGSVTTYCTVTVKGVSHTMWLAVMNMKNQAMLNPPSTEIANTKMRCLVKALAMFGLGHYIYAGESLPLESNEIISYEQSVILKNLLEKTNSNVAKFCLAFKCDSVDQLLASNYNFALTKLNEKEHSMKTKGPKKERIK
mgnify:FL=1